jgi:hypothetical protein
MKTETVAAIDQSVVQITAEHVRDADRLFAEVRRGLPDGRYGKYETAPKGVPVAVEFGAISWNDEIVHDPAFFPHARVGQDLYREVLFSRSSMKNVLEVISNMQDQNLFAYGVDIDPNKILGEQDTLNAEDGITYETLGIWTKETDLMPEAVKAKLGVIGGEK